MAMTFAEIDRTLADWNHHLVPLAEELLRLKADAASLALNASAPAARLAGRTAAAARPLADLPVLLQAFGQLQALVDRVSRLRADAAPLFGREQARREIEAVLLGGSLSVPEDRSLPEYLSPAMLLTYLSTKTNAATEAARVVGEAWAKAAEAMEQGEAETALFERQYATLLCATPADLVGCRVMLARLKPAALCDPMAVVEAFDQQFSPQLQAARQALTQHHQVQELLVRAHRTLGSLEDLEGAVRRAGRDALAKIQGTSLPEPLLVGAEMREWLNRLERRRPVEAADTLLTGLRRWDEAARDRLDRQQHALSVLLQPLALRDELRGRLGALKAKAQSYGLAEDSSLMRRSETAENELYAQPANLERAQLAVSEYERALNRASAHVSSQAGRVETFR